MEKNKSKQEDIVSESCKIAECKTSDKLNLKRCEKLKKKKTMCLKND